MNPPDDQHYHGHGFGTLPHKHDGGDRPHTRTDHDQDRFLRDCYMGVRVQSRQKSAGKQALDDGYPEEYDGRFWAD